jgi:hypothetical protein
MMPPPLLILATPVYRGSVAMSSVTRAFRSTHYGDERQDQHTLNTMGVVDPDQMSI